MMNEPLTNLIPFIHFAKYSYLTHSEFVMLNTKEGSSVQLKCALVDIKEDSTIKWLKNGAEVAYESTTNSSHKSRYDVDFEDYRLTISEVSLEDDGVYDCAMYNERQEFVIKSKRRFKLAVQGWWNKFISQNSFFMSFFSYRNQATYCLLKIRIDY